LLEALEADLAADATEDALAIAVVVLASAAGEGVPLDADESRGASRRALLLLAAGGDPERGLALNGRAVCSLAEELRTVDRQLALEAGLGDLRSLAVGFPHVSELVAGLAATPDLAWRAYAASVLAEELGTDV
jgi:hypothetical protein